LDGFSYVFGESLFKKHHIEPIQFVGYQGIFGLILSSVVVGIVSYIPCSFGIDICVFTSKGGFMESPEVYLRQVG
jgi:hypothetical protein